MLSREVRDLSGMDGGSSDELFTHYLFQKFSRREMEGGKVFDFSGASGAIADIDWYSS